MRHGIKGAVCLPGIGKVTLSQHRGKRDGLKQEGKVGTGKLYRLSDNEFIVGVNYQLLHTRAATNWWG